LDASLTTLLCKIFTVAKSKLEKTDCTNSQTNLAESSTEAVTLKGLFADDNDDNDYCLEQKGQTA
jgi:hypothetical protein